MDYGVLCNSHLQLKTITVPIKLFGLSLNCEGKVKGGDKVHIHEEVKPRLILKKEPPWD